MHQSVFFLHNFTHFKKEILGFWQSRMTKKCYNFIDFSLLTNWFFECISFSDFACCYIIGWKLSSLQNVIKSNCFFFTLSKKIFSLKVSFLVTSFSIFSFRLKLENSCHKDINFLTSTKKKFANFPCKQSLEMGGF